MPDHVHMLVSIPPKISVASFMGYLKGKSSFIMFDRHANLKYKFGNRHFWAEEYYVSTVGLNDATVKKYIRDQEVGVKPKYHNGRHITKWWTCGHCGSRTTDSVGDNYCRNCGFRILWDDPRCLTGWREERKNERADHE